MRHSNSHRKFSRSPAHRRALLRSLATSFFRHGEIETTVQKAKDLRPVVEKLISAARVDGLAARRNTYSYLMDKEVVQKLFSDIAPRYVKRPGGYTRVIRTRVRNGDAAQMARISLV